MSIFQIIAILFALFMVYTVTIHRKKKTLSVMEASFWSSIWILFIVIAIFPNLLLSIANWLHFSRVFDLLIVIALMILSAVTFSNYFINKKLHSKLEVVVRSLAIKDTKTRNEN